VGEVRLCSRCVLGTADRCTISFDDAGVCSYCRDFERHWASLPQEPLDREQALQRILSRIRSRNRRQGYDAILGVSGGLDSSYLAYIAKSLGLRPLLVHFDNGWNSEIAVRNVENIATRLGLDLRTHVIDWEDFRELQLTYLRASVVDIEVLTDHAIYATLYKFAMEMDIPFILSGANVATEGILPLDWVFAKKDHVNIRAIHKAFGTRKLRNFPLLTSRMKRQITRSGIEIIELLNVVDYRVAPAQEIIERQLDWRPYGGKHYESVWTRFYQGYILPRKFGIDKRKAHLATLINSSQLTRDDAFKKLEEPIYPPDVFERDYPFALKKLGLTQNEFEGLMNSPARSHYEFDFERPGSWFNNYPVLRPLRPGWEVFKVLTGIDRDRLRRFFRG
jgi:N-acetyl sugar amidotransferase